MDLNENKLNSNDIDDLSDDNEIEEYFGKKEVITRIFRIRKKKRLNSKELILQYRDKFYQYKIPCILLKVSNGDWYITYLDCKVKRPSISSDTSALSASNFTSTNFVVKDIEDIEKTKTVEYIFKPEIVKLKRDEVLMNKIFTNVDSNLLGISADLEKDGTESLIKKIIDFDGKSISLTRGRTLTELKSYIRTIEEYPYKRHDDYINDILNYLLDVSSCTII